MKIKSPPLKFRGKEIPLSRKVCVMGILNLTPDSFFNGGRYNTLDKALKRVEELIEEGADIVDVGGESTRPGSKRVGVEEEKRRVLPVIEKIRKEFPSLPLSLDTYKAEVAKEGLERGVEMINDISGLHFDPGLKEVISKYDAYVVIMHIKGTPQTMQLNPSYKDLMGEIISYLKEGIKLAQEAGISEDKIIIDPGIGFGKTWFHNLLILKRLPELKLLGKPILVGTSRKSFLGKVLGLKPEERLEGSLASSALAVFQGADLVRVHDVKKTRRAVDLARAIREAGYEK